MSSWLHDRKEMTVKIPTLALLVCAAATDTGMFRSAQAELIAHWPLDEVADGRTPDKSAGRHPAVLHGRKGQLPRLERGTIGRALRFDADQQQHLLPHPPMRLSSLAKFTAMVWVHPMKEKANQDLLCQKSEHWGREADVGWRLRYGWGTATLELGIGSRRYRNTSGGGTVSRGYWIHIAGVFDGRQSRLYINGVLRGVLEIDRKWRNGDYALVIAGFTGSKKHYAFEGLLDDIRIFDHALTEEEIVRTAAEGLSGQQRKN